MWYWIFRPFVIFLSKLFFKLNVEGIENLPKKNNFIVVANHTSYLDPFILGAVIPKKIYWLAVRDLYKASPAVRWFFHVTGAMPDGKSSENLIRLLTNNKIVGLFPEGIRTHDGKLNEFRRGAALLALRTGRPIVPCAILGAYEAFPRSAKFPKPRPIKIKIGKPQYLLKEFEDVVDDIRLQEGTFKIRSAIEGMMHARQ
ncbi:MAG: 1-acyl-sn-glycerol-3-phosphate acyltransferase [Candidatus Omnitrophica bacterium]|nr:1-acyl-sn-glycerol-3-phosphate acyltransferase [Candidatus Omnitrophota bacterium]